MHLKKHKIYNTCYRDALEIHLSLRSRFHNGVDTSFR